PHDTRLADAQVALWRGQANDAYWHGVFGGCYLPHLRRAVKSALLECERRLAESAALPTPAWTREDGNGDGREEVYVRTRELAVTLNPALGGAITELGYLAGDLDVAVTFTRGAGASVQVEKTVTIRDATVEVRYRLGTPAGMTGVSGRWAVQFNVALTAGDAPGRYLTATGRPSLGSTGRERGAAG